MEVPAAVRPDAEHVTLDESVRTCRPAIVPQSQPVEANDDVFAGPDWNIVLGED